MGRSVWWVGSYGRGDGRDQEGRGAGRAGRWGGAWHLEGAGRRRGAPSRAAEICRSSSAAPGGVGAGFAVGCRHVGGRRAGGQEVSRSRVCSESPRASRSGHRFPGCASLRLSVGDPGAWAATAPFRRLHVAAPNLPLSSFVPEAQHILGRPLILCLLVQFAQCRQRPETRQISARSSSRTSPLLLSLPVWKTSA